MEGRETRGPRLKTREFTQANYHSTLCLNEGKRQAHTEQAAEGEDGGAECYEVSQMETISPRGGQTAAMALAESRDGAGSLMDTWVKQHEQCRHVSLSFSFFLFFTLGVHSYCQLQVKIQM